MAVSWRNLNPLRGSGAGPLTDHSEAGLPTSGHKTTCAWRRINHAQKTSTAKLPSKFAKCNAKAAFHVGRHTRGGLRAPPPELALVMTAAILFIPPDAHRWLETCAQYAARHGYEVVCVVSSWADATLMSREKDAVVVVGRWEHLPANRLPRVEAVLEEDGPRAAPMPPPTQRRPQRRT